MKEKYLLLLVVILLISGCLKQEDNNNNNNNRSNYTAKKMQDNNCNYFMNTDDDINKDENNDDTFEDNQHIDDSLVNANDIDSQEMITNKKPIVNNDNDSLENIEQENDINLVTNDIDCLDIDECLEKTLSIQYDYQKILANVFYHEVLSNNNILLGYNIEYVLKDNIFESWDECIEVTDSLKEKIGLKMENYVCNEDGSMVVNEN